MTVTIHDPLLSPGIGSEDAVPIVLPAECEADPPPPYPSRSRRERHHRLRTSHHQQTTTESDYGPTTPEDGADETTPFLSPRQGRRPRARSLTGTIISTVSAAPSLAHSVLSFFQSDDDESEAGDTERPSEQLPNGTAHTITPGPRPLLSMRGLQRYFRPLGRAVYWKAIFHLLVLNFPYALLAWVYLFVFTLTGTALLMALPVGAVLCFIDLLGARILSRGELAIQYQFHGPLAYPPPFPPRPIFTRYRDPTQAEVEEGITGPVKQTSFYKNSYAMFTDSTSYQALFYFLVIKASITILLSVLLIIVVPLSLIFVFPAPAIFRATRKLGIWQANIAIEGLYLAVR